MAGEGSPMAPEWSLSECRAAGSRLVLQDHQRDAIERLLRWFSGEFNERRGGLLVLPTGSGKTVTAMNFLCRGPDASPDVAASKPRQNG